MHTDEAVAALVAALGPDRVAVDPSVAAAYSRDMTPLAPSGRPLAVVLSTSTAEVVAIVKICAAHGVPIVPRGAGSGLTGAANAIDGAVTVVMTRMNRREVGGVRSAGSGQQADHAGRHADQ